MILSQVSLEHLDEDVQVGLDGRDVLGEPSVSLPELLVGLFLRLGESPELFGELARAFDDAADNAGQTDDSVGHPIDLHRLLLRIRRELCLLPEQKLHGSFDLVRRHRLEIHENTVLSMRSCHCAIVLRTTEEQGVGR